MSESIDSNTMKYKLINLYQQNRASILEGLPENMNRYRDAAIRDFDRMGIPEKGEEKYKYTDLMWAFGKTYGYAFKAHTINVDSSTLFQCAVPDLDTHTLILENGWFYERNNEHAALPKEIVACSIREASVTHAELFAKHYNQQAQEHPESVSVFNTAFAQDGMFLYIPDGFVMGKPIQIINLLRGNNPLLVNQRNLIVAGKNSQAKVIVCDHTLSHQNFLSNTVTEVFVDEQAVFDYYNIQNQHNQSSQVASLYIYQKKGSNTLTNTLTLHGGFVRNNVFVKLAEEHAEAHVYGLSLIDGKQHVDNYTFIDHAVPNCLSNEMYKNILDDDATGAFNGRILVRKDAQKTRAYQSNKNICLTPTARFFTKPQLEIYADDVKCSHGATVGQINEEAQFYLQSRGIGGREARMMLMYAFAYEVIRNIRVPVLVERYGELVERRLRGELSRCEGCFVHCN
ncbi:MAG: Fe-S cluster assembly protein SufD [Bacteroidetes bacterium GWE2_40_63]|jgi:Fe-S cluster assembly protein SufD|nr:MAG: Fe-S cluster assembly protein SufD [Bacteroidetes bacterium GWA2_40_14]OFX59979.1 MAG: Fe-S cluster assembly protein SufD [Bacteroidetes bacterium GWC2_40_13]OFX70925.1 MAG: Fe-S cluster assembly protein SufD [Bacteroidetes bacterium GWD2_40_43]OFX91192.1 MAG: Fe-S cluster assembly protein SufD [Bacteroidetes bacterium GWE2_40_63]OFY22868.1 MAG: Fe-S cluster assembly protein SufD [Bacteroidetes bacterium GWF2_40_13]OFZ25900.1 MAG: Fe-S cluster assembly protein SufD [Bacteroidetes bacte